MIGIILQIIQGIIIDNIEYNNNIIDNIEYNNNYNIDNIKYNNYNRIE